MMKANNESGRSILETIAVVAIIGLLMVASLIGYNFVVQAWRSHQTVDQVNSLVVGMRSGNLATRYQKDEKIPVQTIVRGLKTRGDAAVLPDSSDSWAQVTSLGVNSYMIEMEVSPDTCVSLLEEVNGADLIHVSLPNEGCKTQDCEVITDIGDQSLAQWGIAKDTRGLSAQDKTERSENIRAVCDAQPKVAMVWGCAEGMTSYFYAGKCQRCPRGQIQDANANGLLPTPHSYANIEDSTFYVDLG